MMSLFVFWNYRTLCTVKCGDDYNAAVITAGDYDDDDGGGDD